MAKTGNPQKAPATILPSHVSREDTQADPLGFGGQITHDHIFRNGWNRSNTGSEPLPVPIPPPPPARSTRTNSGTRTSRGGRK